MPPPYPFRDRLLVLLVKGLVVFFSRLPRGFAYGLGRRLGWFYGHVIRYHRKDAFDALQRAFPNWSKAEVRSTVNRMYLNLGMNLIDSFRLAGIDPETMKGETRMLNQDILDQAWSEGNGMLCITAHLGSWEVLATISPLYGYDMDIVVKKVRPEALNDYLVAIRETCGTTMIPNKKTFRRCLRSLQQGRLLGFMLDQNMVRSEGIFVDFFGRPACTSPGAALLAYTTQCPVIPVYAERKPDGTHDLHVIERFDPPADRNPETIQAYTRMLVKTVEDEIRKRPDQWIWIHRRWRTQPLPEEKSGKNSEPESKTAATTKSTT